MNTQTNNKRRYKLGTYTVFVTLIAVALAIGFNLFFNEIPANLTAFDLSNEKIYTIDDSTKELIASIDKDITIYLVAVQGQEDLYISEIIEKYAALSSHIKVVHRDPAYFPTFVSKYTTEQLQTNSLIVESEDRYKIIKYSDIYVAQYYYDQSYNMQQEVSFYLHSQLASALDYVTSDSLPKLYMLTGHGETALGSSLSGYITSENIETEDLNLITGAEVPEDASAVFINAPTADITVDEASALIDYLSNGGKVILTTDLSLENCPNLDAVTKEMGLAKQHGVVIETNPNNYASYPYYIVPVMKNHSATENVYGKYYTFLPTSHGIQKIQELPEEITVTELLTTTTASYLKIAGYDIQTYEKEDGDIVGPINVGVISENSSNGAKLLWIASASITNESVDSRVSGGNSAMLINGLTYLCNKESSVDIVGITFENSTLVVTSAQANLWTSVFCVIIPVFTLGLGLFVWIRRRKR